MLRRKEEKKMNISVFVRTKEQLETIKKYPIKTIYTNNLELIKENPDIYYEVPKYYEKEKLPKNILINDIGIVEELKEDKNIIIDYGMNVANSSTIELFLKYNVKKIILSLEMNLEELKFLEAKKYPLEIYIYGRPKGMTLKNHPIFTKGQYELEDIKKERYKVEVLENELVSIYQKEPINQIKNISKYLFFGINNFRIDFYDEDEKSIEKLLEKVTKK